MGRGPEGGMKTLVIIVSVLVVGVFLIWGGTRLTSSAMAPALSGNEAPRADTPQGAREISGQERAHILRQRQEAAEQRSRMIQEEQATPYEIERRRLEEEQKLLEQQRQIIEQRREMREMQQEAIPSVLPESPPRPVTDFGR